MAGWKFLVLTHFVLLMRGGVALGQKSLSQAQNFLPNATPLQGLTSLRFSKPQWVMF
jgi:hypothetical protein